MSVRQPAVTLAARDEIVAPPAPRACEDRSFGLPPALHIMTAILFLGFVSVLSAAFAHQEMVVPFAIFAVFITAFFAVPGLWARMEPDDSRTKSLSWSEFRANGIETATGRESAGSATILVLLLPFLILCWALAVATIAALV